MIFLGFYYCTFAKSDILVVSHGYYVHSCKLESVKIFPAPALLSSHPLFRALLIPPPGSPGYLSLGTSHPLFTPLTPLLFEDPADRWREHTVIHRSYTYTVLCSYLAI